MRYGLFQMLFCSEEAMLIKKSSKKASSHWLTATKHGNFIKIQLWVMQKKKRHFHNNAYHFKAILILKCFYFNLNILGPKFTWALKVLLIYSCLYPQQRPSVVKFSSWDENLFQYRALSVFCFPPKSNVDKMNSGKQ